MTSPYHHYSLMLLQLLHEGADLVAGVVPVETGDGATIGTMTVSVKVVAALRYFFKKK
jgi:hypothetical protein